VRGFLGLADYYCKFLHIRLRRSVADHSPQEGRFSWGEEAAATFAALKAAVTTTPILAMPNFTKTFVLECDASSHGFGAVLIQEGHPIAFFSRPVAPCHHALATYERELIGLVHVVCHWMPHLWSRRFLVKTDHYNLKYLLDQHLPPSHNTTG
jgi:hypothetical protein